MVNKPNPADAHSKNSIIMLNCQEPEKAKEYLKVYDESQNNSPHSIEMGIKKKQRSKIKDIDKNAMRIH